MRTGVKLLLAAAAGALGISGFLVAPSSGDNGSPTVGQVGICHATGSQTNPFVFITPDASGVYDGHAGLDHQYGEDIIPAFSYVDAHGDTVNFAGQNLSTLYGGVAGSVLLAHVDANGHHDCQAAPTTSSSTSSSTSTTTTGEKTVTVTTTLPGSTVNVTTTLPGQTVTAPAQTITLPGTTVTAPAQTVTGPTQTVTVAGKTVTVPGKTVTVVKTKPCPKVKPKAKPPKKVKPVVKCPPGERLYNGSCHHIVAGKG